MATVSSLLTQSLRQANILGIGQTVDNDVLEFARLQASSMLDSWKIQRLFVYQILQRSLSWPAATVSRTIGTGGNFNVARPDRIDSAFVTVSGDEYPLRVLRNRDEYDGITDKGAAADIPEYLFYDPGFSTGTLYLWGVPNGAVTLLLNVYQDLQDFGHVSTTFALPPGYQDAIELSVAERLLAAKLQNVPASLALMAAKARKAIQDINAPSPIMTTEVGYMTGRSRGNILSGG